LRCPIEAPFPNGLLADTEEFLLEQKDVTDGADSYPGLYSRPLLFPLQRRREQEAMVRIVRERRPRVVCEIGADKGGGLYCWAKCLPSVQTVLACEVRGCPYGRLFERAFPHVNFIWLPYPSRDRECLMQVERAVQKHQTIDMLFLDGDKKCFDRDFDAYLRFMSPGGVVFFHDITDEDPGEAYHKIINRGYQHEEIIDRSEAVESLSREADGIPPACPHEDWLRHWRGRSCGVGVVFL
jgi:hypothetical protein